MGTAKGVVAARNPALLVEHGGHIEIVKGWVKSLFHQMGYVKRKGSNAGKITVSHFNEVQEEFLPDVQAEVLMNDVHPQLIFNWDQTAVHYVPIGEWTMHRYKKKIIPIASSVNKRQIRTVLAVTVTGEFLPPQMIYKGRTVCCHPKVAFPSDWDIWHTTNHSSTEETMIRYVEKIIVLFVSCKSLRFIQRPDNTSDFFHLSKPQHYSCSSTTKLHR